MISEHERLSGNIIFMQYMAVIMGTSQHMLKKAYIPDSLLYSQAVKFAAVS